MRRAHLREYLVKPLKRAVQVNFDPARSARHVLPVVLGTPSLHERHPITEPSYNDITKSHAKLFLPDCAHLRKLVNSFEAVIDRLRE